jgi:predicted ATP-grasp superfamily ATP-dependent carboligase
MHCIIKPIDGAGGLYLGNLDAAKSLHSLKEHSISAIVTVMSQNELHCYDSSIQ